MQVSYGTLKDTVFCVLVVIDVQFDSNKLTVTLDLVDLSILLN